MMGRRVVLSCAALLVALGACATTTPKSTVNKRSSLPALGKPRDLSSIFPARFVLLEGVGVSYDETGDPSPVQARDPALVSGKRIVLEGGRIVESATFAEPLFGFRSLPARLGSGFVFWSDEHTYHSPTFLGKLTPFAKIAARGGVRPWFDSFVLRTEIGPLEVTPTSFAVRRTELARFSEMLSADGKSGIRTDALGQMEVSVDGGKTFRSLTIDDAKKFSGPFLGPSNTLTFRRDFTSDLYGTRPDRIAPETLLVDPSGKLIPFDPKAHLPLKLEVPVYSAPPDEPALTRRFAPPELGMATAAGALVPGEQIVWLREASLRVMSAKTGEFIQDLPLSFGTQDFGHCQPITLGQDVFLACTHATGAHLYALRGAPTTLQLEATFPEPGGFVAGLGRRLLFQGRCGSTPPTVRDFLGHGLSEEAPDAGEPDPNAPAPSPEVPTPPEDLPEKPKDEAAVCVRRDDGSWVERRIQGLKDRKKSFFLPGDHGDVTVVLFDNLHPDEPAPTTSEGVHIIHVSTLLAKFEAASFFQTQEPNEPQVRTVARDIWLDEKDGSVHGWELQKPKSEEPEQEEEQEPEHEAKSKELSEEELIKNMLEGVEKTVIVGVQIKIDGTIEKHPAPEGAVTTIVGGPYAFVTARASHGPAYYESTNGGRTFVPVKGSGLGPYAESYGGELQGCSIIGCALGGRVVRLGWGSDVLAPAKSTKSDDKQDDLDALTSKVFDPHTFVPERPRKTTTCRLDAKEGAAAADTDKPFAVTTATQDDLNVGSAVDRKWTAWASIPFEVKPMHQVLFEDVNVEALKGESIPVLRSTAANPVGLFWRTKDFRFDMAPGPKRKPLRLSPDVRAMVAAEIDRETFVLLDTRLGEVQLLKGETVRTLMRINQVPDVNQTSITLAQRSGSSPATPKKPGDDGLAIALIQSGTGDILLGDLDLGSATVGPLRVAGNLRNLVTGTACVRGARDHRLIMSSLHVVEFEPADELRSGRFGLSLLTLGAGNPCLEASEMRLANEGTVTVRYVSAGTGPHPAMLHERGKSLRASCTRE